MVCHHIQYIFLSYRPLVTYSLIMEMGWWWIMINIVNIVKIWTLYSHQQCTVCVYWKLFKTKASFSGGILTVVVNIADVVVVLGQVVCNEITYMIITQVIVGYLHHHHHHADIGNTTVSLSNPLNHVCCQLKLLMLLLAELFLFKSKL